MQSLVRETRRMLPDAAKLGSHVTWEGAPAFVLRRNRVSPFPTAPTTRDLSRRNHEARGGRLRTRNRSKFNLKKQQPLPQRPFEGKLLREDCCQSSLGTPMFPECRRALSPTGAESVPSRSLAASSRQHSLLFAGVARGCHLEALSDLHSHFCSRFVSEVRYVEKYPSCDD